MLPMPHSLTDSQRKDRATQLLIKYKSGALVTQNSDVRLKLLIITITFIIIIHVVDNHDWNGPRYPTPALDNVHKSRHLCLSQVFDLYRYHQFSVTGYPVLFGKC